MPSSSPPASPKTPRTRHSSARAPAAPPPALPLPPLPSPGPSSSHLPQSTSPQLPPLPSLPVLTAPLPATPPSLPVPSDLASPASSHFSTTSGASIFTAFSTGKPSTRPSSADSEPPSSPDVKSPEEARGKPVRQRLERARSVTADGIDFDLVTPQLGPSLSNFGPTGSTSPPDTPTAEESERANTPKALADCGCDAPLPPGVDSDNSPLSEGEEYDAYDEEAERLLQEAGLGGLGLGLLRRQSEVVQLSRQGGPVRTSIAVGPNGAILKRTTTPPDPPPSTPPPTIEGPALLRLLKKQKEARERKRRSKEFDRFGIPTDEAIASARKCELRGEGGTTVTFDQLLRDRRRKVVVVFLRHAWCGLCAQFVTALNKAAVALDDLSTASSIASFNGGSATSSSPEIPPLYILLISNGSHTLIPTYRVRLDCPFPLYMDRTRTLYKALGMNLKSWNMGKDSEKGSYIVKSQIGNVTSSIAAGVAMPAYPGSQGQLGGEFVFESAPDGTVKCLYASRMNTTRSHSEIKDIFAAAGVRLNAEDAESVYGGL
ncbi:hypothetical protein JCM8547_000625 [Rhodosporidiobolus lusitaniae]